MSARVCAVLIASALFHSAVGAERWERLKSPDFEMYSSAGERGSRDTIRYFEQVRSFFIEVLGAAQRDQKPVYIIAFGSEKEFELYRPNEVAAAFYQPTKQRDFIVLGRIGEEYLPAVVHEYVHLLAQSADLKLPLWLNEGIADVYSTLKPTGNKVIVGTPPPGRVLTLLREKWIALPLVLAAKHDSPYYNEKNRASAFYGESWALTHMLMLGTEYRSGYSKCIAAIRAGTPSEDALVSTYGKPLDRIERDLHEYVRSTTVNGSVFNVKLEKESAEVPIEPLPDYDLKLRLAEVADRPGHEPQARATLEILTRDEPKRPEAFADLGYLSWREGHREEAVDVFDKAFDLGYRERGMLWDYGRMAEQSHPEDAARALGSLVEIQPDRVEARIELAAVQLRLKQPQAALATLRPATKVSAKDAPRLFRIMAYAQLDNNNREEARNAAKRLAETAQEQADKDEAQRLLNFLDSSSAVAIAPLVMPSPGNDSNSGPPRMARAPKPVAAPAQPLPPPRPSIEGVFVQLNCSGAQATVVVEAGGKKRAFLIDDPNKIIVPGQAGGFADLACGPQKRVSVRIEYDPPSASLQGIDGLLRLIEFHP
jgi:tetratricopeptide (TPR) repeat protein